VRGAVFPLRRVPEAPVERLKEAQIKSYMCMCVCVNEGEMNPVAQLGGGETFGAIPNLMILTPRSATALLCWRDSGSGGGGRRIVGNMYCKHLSGLGLDLEMRWKQAKLDLIIMEHSSEQSRYCWVSVIHGHLNIRSSRVSLAVQETSPILKEGPLPLKTVSVYLSKGQMLSEDGIQDVGFSGEASLLKAENRPKKKTPPIV
jgi:hypothetical protein